MTDSHEIPGLLVIVTFN